MKKLLLTSVAFVSFAAGSAFAADMPAKARPAPLPTWSWAGTYIGTHTGVAFGLTQFSDPYAPSIYGDEVRSPAGMFGVQVGRNWQDGMLVYGVEADAALLSSDGTNTCLQFNPFFVGGNCRAQPRALGSVTGRVGVALGAAGHTLIYGKGGFAWDFVDYSVTINAPPTGPLLGSRSIGRFSPGWTVGVGWEEALSPAWSFKVEYDYVSLARNTIATPASVFSNGAPVAGGASNIDHQYHVLKTGLNYHFGADPWARWPVAAPGIIGKAPAVAAWAPGWEVEVGARYVSTTSRWQKDLGATTNQANQTTLNSRLTYDNMSGDSGEIFGRVDSPYKIFVKGYVGGGKLRDGTLIDEDWDGIVYSNTTSNQSGGRLRYATVDVGYDWLIGPGYKVGPFIGYNYFKENFLAYGCAQTGNQNQGCVPAIPTSVLVITETDTYRSLRVGTAAEIMLLDRLKMSVDAAYIPYMTVSGSDNHVLRALVSPESGKGVGVQLDVILSYYITEQFSVGAGGRYWAMWTTRNAITNFGGAPCPCQTLPQKTDLYGAFFQAAYKFK